jgi:CRP/FNR family transcriptional regulator, cyclic AMP receptor protein
MESLSEGCGRIQKLNQQGSLSSMKTCSALMQRFVGPDSLRSIAEELAKQEIITGHSNVMTELARKGRIEPLRRGQTIIRQGDATNDVFFVLCGKLLVKRNNREIAARGPGDSVGEMAMIDRRQRRSATVTATEESVVLRVSQPDFATVALQYSDLWRNLAVQQAKRLRQRLESVRPKNDVPIAFIGSSKESLPVAKIVEKALGKVADVRIWKEGVFRADQFTLESLEAQARQVDFAVMVFAPDDRIFCRGKESGAPRDNVVFELGLFMGALGRKRAFVIKPRSKDLKLPTDLLGRNHIEYAVGPGRPKHVAIREACQGLIEIIKREGTL